MPLANIPNYDRPRERMRRLGIGSLTDDEVLALVLGSGQSGRSVLAFARSILRRTGGFPGLATMDFARFETLPGVGPATAGRLVAIIEIWWRAGAPSAWTRLVDAAAIADIVRPELLHRDSERFVVVIADRAARPIELVLLRGGGVDETSIQPADILQAVLTSGGRSFAVAHNTSLGGPGRICRRHDAHPPSRSGSRHHRIAVPWAHPGGGRALDNASRCRGHGVRRVGPRKR
ncbi:hypothetical protein ATY41_07530 [Leifsonia xyli subsp. xyli]|uniref:Uncharacterized protein n=1 Tax=Leifsonia xyli subsp. xyli TaxID=59736 RepID=A0A1E2SMF3_LEIXY|nr:UPF0758 domain-containing protein [Leifsonia xyli]ODA90911.1 hypothetical protein ATY41_07530 [Leifsonia xyli subsp. xyli]